MSEEKQSHCNESTEDEMESFYYSISHDLRAPLRSIDGFSQALMEDYIDVLDPTARDYLEKIRSSCQLMGRLIDDILFLSRLSRMEMRLADVDLSKLAHEVADGLKLELSGCGSAEFIIADDIHAYGDESLLKHVIYDLMSNASKFMNKQEHPKIEFGITCTDGDRAYFVRDNSMGFATDSPDTGLGLASVQRIVNRHGGRVWAEENPDQGVSFYFNLNIDNSADDIL
ncbi:MAG: sensor histidine kinase [Saccharofermentanales bacterium]